MASLQGSGDEQLRANNWLAARIADAWSRLQPAERKVARFIADHGERVIYLSAAELGEQVGVSDATVIRCSQALGFRGFYDLKIAVARSPQLVSHDWTRHIEMSHDLGEAVSRNIQDAMSSLQSLQTLMDPAELDASVRTIQEARKIILLGSGTSAIAAQILYYKLSRLGLAPVFHPDLHMQIVSCAHATASDAVVAISHSGSTRDVVACVELARRNHRAKVIAITNHRRSPLSSKADHVLLTPAPETPLTSGLSPSLVVQTVAIECLAVGLLMRLGSAGRRAIRMTAESVGFTKV